MEQTIQLGRVGFRHLAEIQSIMGLSYHPRYAESAEVLRVKIALSLDYGGVALFGGRVCGYLLAYAAPLDYVSVIDSPLRPEKPFHSLYVHDLAVHPGFRGLRIAERLHRDAVRKTLGGLPCSTLVAVGGAESFWSRLGYRPTRPRTRDARRILASYGRDAVFMKRFL